MEEEVVCRICRLPAAPDNALFSPCKCSGSIKHVHQECLISWLNHSGHQHCELCRHKFEFRPVYAEDAPSRLPLVDLAWGLAGKSLAGLALAARALAVAVTWLFVVPLLTCWMWRLAFLTSLSQGVRELGQRLQPVLVLADCIQGSLISSALILLVLLATYTAEQIRAYWQIIQPHPPPPPLAPPAPPPPPPAQLQPAPGGSSDSSEALGLLDSGTSSGSGGRYSTASGTGSSRGAEAGPSGEEATSGAAEGREHGARLARLRRERPVGSQGDRPALGLPDAGWRPAEAPRRRRPEAWFMREQQQQLPPPPPPPPAPEPPAGEAAGGRQERDFAFNELIGLEGPLDLLLENAATVLFTIWAFMTAALWAPFMLGRTVVPTLLVWRDVAAASPAWRAARPLLASAAAALGRGRATVAPAAAAQAGGWEGGRPAAVLPLLRRLAEDFEAHLSGPRLSDWLCLGIGYSVLGALTTLGFCSLVVWKLLWRSGLQEGWRGRGRVLRAALADAVQQTRAHLGYAAVLVKVSLVLALELTLLPAVNGCWVDLCLLPAFGHTWAQRAAWLRASPLSFLLAHWLLGMAVLMGVATFLSVLRQQLRPGALPFFRDPYEGDDEPMRALMTLGLGQQLEREACAFACLACLAVLLLHAPLRLTRAALPGALPLRLGLGSPFVEAPTDLLLFHFALPLTIPRLRLRQTVVRGTRAWLRCACRLLRLEDYLLPPRPGQQPPAADAPPALIPLGLAGEEEGGRGWRAEVEAARARSGRLLALLAALLGSLVLLHTALLNLPLLTGKALFRAAGLATQHDLYNAACGGYALWGLWLLGRQAWRLAGVRSAAAAAQSARRWAGLGLKAAALGCVGLGALPALLGLFLELALLPLRLRPGETPALFGYQDWAVGLLLLRLAARWLLGGAEPEAGAGRPAGPLRRLAGHARRLQRGGLARAGLRDAFSNVLWPPLRALGLAVAVPYVLARGVVPRLPGATPGGLQALFVWGWAAEAAGLAAGLAIVRAAAALERLGSRLRDQRYLLHRELVNVADAE